jgi:hypothetical protein
MPGKDSEMLTDDTKAKAQAIAAAIGEYAVLSTDDVRDAEGRLILESGYPHIDVTLRALVPITVDVDELMAADTKEEAAKVLAQARHSMLTMLYEEQDHSGGDSYRVCNPAYEKYQKHGAACPLRRSGFFMARPLNPAVDAV